MLRKKSLCLKLTDSVAFSGSLCFNGTQGYCQLQNAYLLKIANTYYKKSGTPAIIELSTGKQAHHKEKKRTSGYKLRVPKVLLFKNIYNSGNKENTNWISAGTLYLASGLKKSGISVLLSDAKVSLDPDKFITGKNELETLLMNNPDILCVGISLCEDYFRQVKALIDFLSRRTRSFIGVGGVMPTLTPEHTFIHLPRVNFLVRGSGEYIFPQIVKCLTGFHPDSALSQARIESLLQLNGFIFQNSSQLIIANLDKVNCLKNYDASILDFSFIEKENVQEGINLYTSRGCFNNCFFCTTPGKGQYCGKSFQNIKLILKDYYSRLKHLFPRSIPQTALQISFHDDDFFADAKRAALFFDYLPRTPFKVNFFQAGINSFYTVKRGRRTASLDTKLLTHISASAFSRKQQNIYLGSENFCDEELQRLGKGYTAVKIEKVVRVLSRKKINQSHHFIASNHATSLKNIVVNLISIAQFQISCGRFFGILTPIIPYLVSLFPSASYRIARLNNLNRYLAVTRKLTVKGYPEFDYPLINHDIPMDKAVKAMIPFLDGLFRSEADYIKILDDFLFELLLLKERLPTAKDAITRVIDEFASYPEIIRKKTGRGIGNSRCNIQLMLTRRCQLRCAYCPITKRNADMDENTLRKSIDLLFTSRRQHLRLDFTGGEPLLRFDLLKQGVHYAKKIAQKKNKKISFYLVSNLIALNKEIADFLAKEDIFLELSIDGEESFHNRNKACSRVKNPYQVTTSRLQYILCRNIPHYAVMVTTPGTVKHLSRNFYHLLTLGIRNIGINYSLGTIWDEASRKIFFRELDIIQKKAGRFIKKGIVRLSNGGSRVEPAVLNAEIMVDCDGSIYFLTDLLFENKTKSRLPPVTTIAACRDINDIVISKFLILYHLLNYYQDTHSKEVILNNITMGKLTGAYFKKNGQSN
ncbi:MAG: radical SAM protein [Candidatus Omnitrophota bacterium]|jgi:sulfatase maturation enzyme AslB (radical SAM superfamily)